MQEVKVNAKQLFPLDTQDRIIKFNALEANLLGAYYFNSQANINVLNNGNFGLSTASANGLSSAYTAITWKGMQLNSALNGVADLNLIDLSLFDELHFQRPNSKSQKNIGLFSQGIELKNNDSTLNAIGFTLSSFSSSRLNYKWKKKYKKSDFQVATSLFNSKNNFPYQEILSGNKDLLRMQNADFQNYSFLSSYSRTLNAFSKLEFSIWLNASERGLPASLTQNISLARQADSSLRSAMTFTHAKAKNELVLSVNHTAETNLYNDTLLKIYGRHLLNKSNFVADFSHMFSTKWTAKMGGLASNSNVNSTNYENRFNVFQSSVYTNIEFVERNKWSATIQLKLDYFIDKFSLPNGLIQFKSRWNNKQQIDFKLQSLYRFPTLNDLFWNPGGNANLKPENGYLSEFIWHFDSKNLSWRNGISANYLKDKIAWRPSNSGIWMPINILESRNVAINTFIQLNISKEFSWNMNLNYQIGQEKRANDFQQAYYLPRFKGNNEFTYQYKSWKLKSLSNFQSQILASDAVVIKGFVLAGVLVEKQLLLNQRQVQLGFLADNIFNYKYQSIAYRAMPGINFKLSLNINLNKS